MFGVFNIRKDVRDPFPVSTHRSIAGADSMVRQLTLEFDSEAGKTGRQVIYRVFEWVDGRWRHVNEP